MSAVMTQGQRLAAEAAEAAEVRDAMTHPDVVALRVERTRTVVDRFIWAGMILGLAFTMTNVQQFTAHTIGAQPGDLAWWAAWLLDPMVSLVLLGVLRAEQVTARWQVQMGPWPRAAKWSLLAATYVMNTWESYAAGNVAGIVLHSVPPLVVFVGAEAVTDCQDKLTECVHRAHSWATDRTEQRAKAERDKLRREGLERDSHDTRTEQSPEPHTAVHPASATSSAAGWNTLAAPAAPARTAVAHNTPPVRQDPPVRPNRPAPVTRRRRTTQRKKSGGRVLFADYLAIARRALTPGTEVTPAWVREVTGCSRGLSSRLAAELRTEQQHIPVADQPKLSEGKAA